MPLVLEELLDDAPVTWALSYGGPLLPPIILSELITDLPRDIPKTERKLINIHNIDSIQDNIEYNSILDSRDHMPKQASIAPIFSPNNMNNYSFRLYTF